MREFWSEPCWQGSRIRTADCDPLLISVYIVHFSLCNLCNKVGQVIECLLGRQVFEVLDGEWLIAERKGFAVISVFQRQYKPLGLLSYLCGKRSVWNSSTLSLSADVKDDRTCFGIEILVVYEVSLLPSVILCRCQIIWMVDDLIEPLDVLTQVGKLLFVWIVELPWKGSNDKQTNQNQLCYFCVHKYKMTQIDFTLV